MTKTAKNTPASVHQRLLNEAKASSRSFNQLLQHFAIERFLFRLSRGPHAQELILKDALMFPIWSGVRSRPTMDIDFLGRMENSIDAVSAAMKHACEQDVEADGMVFDSETLTAVRITESAEYEGVRVRLQGHLGNARVRIQVDVGFGDEVVPAPIRFVYPSLLDFPSAKLRGYSPESTIAEKYETMVKFGRLNSRMKDFYDIWMLSRGHNFEGPVLRKAMEMTFGRRNTPPTMSSTVFSPAFVDDPGKVGQWRGFVRKLKVQDAPHEFSDVASAITDFLDPVMESLDEGRKFPRKWKAPGPWR